MMLTLTLAAGLLAAPEPRAQRQQGYVVETHGFTKHPKQAEPPNGEGWTIEVRGYTSHLKQPRKEFIIEFQWPRAEPQREPVEGRYQPVEGHYHDDLTGFFKQPSRVQVQVEAVEAFYVDDLPAYFQQLKKP
jgi:hypothetical protein